MTTGRLLAVSQLALSLLLIVCFFITLGFVLYLKLDLAIVRELSPMILLVLYFWFQRQRPHSDDDPSAGGASNGSSSKSSS